MEYQKINKLIDENKFDKFMKKKWIQINSQSKSYSVNKEIRFKANSIRSDLCDYSDSYIKVTCEVELEGNDDDDKINKDIVLKNNAPFTTSTTKINGIFIDNSEDLDIVMPMYNLLNYSKNYVKTNGSFFHYYRDEHADLINSDTSASFKEKIVGKIGNNAKLTDIQIILPLKHLSSFFRSLDISLINCEIELVLNWNNKCVLSGHNAANNPNNVKFQLKTCELYVSVVIL